MVHSLFVAVVGALVGALYGLVAALIFKWVRKAQKMPTWPILTGLLLGLAAALPQWAAALS
ncbi:MAG: hypothetical protein EON86_15890 [Brevundimonas sp.]|nr:MAG: hypothetical protein EON86_15890 [Brevundimonas sp.]